MNDWPIIISILLVTTVSGSLGALSLKHGMNKIDTLSAKAVAKNIWVVLGTVLYIVSAVMNIVLFKYLDYSIAFPMTSLTYAWTVIISYFIFKEKITIKKVLAIALIIIGVIMMAQ